jgi:hypothetical protein
VAYEDFLQEKKILDEVVRKIHDEDQRYTLWSHLWMYWQFTLIIHGISDHAFRPHFQYGEDL